ncbi:MAG: hypothetical protein AAFW87_12490, partial [Pseudomonadota bacterium]
MIGITVGASGDAALGVIDVAVQALSVTQEPTISGAAEIGRTLTVDTGAASGEGSVTMSARQWLRDSVPIPGSTAIILWAQSVRSGS